MPSVGPPQARSPRVHGFETQPEVPLPCWWGSSPPHENHLSCYLVLFALLTPFMVFCNWKKTGD